MSRSSECTHVLALSLQYMTGWPCMLLLSGDPVSGWRITTALLAMGWGYCRNVWFSKWRGTRSCSVGMCLSEMGRRAIWFWVRGGGIQENHRDLLASQC